MKKLMIAAAVAISAVVVNAATANWSTEKVYSYDKGTEASGYLVYLVDSSVTGAAEKLAAGDFSFLTDTGAMAWSGGLSDEGYAEGKSANVYGWNPKGDPTGSKVAETVNAYLIVFDAATLDAAEHAYISSAASGATTALGGNASLTFGATQMNGAKVQDNWTSINVPEPTSGLLLLLGMAGLALRRRRA